MYFSVITTSNSGLHFIQILFYNYKYIFYIRKCLQIKVVSSVPAALVQAFYISERNCCQSESSATAYATLRHATQRYEFSKVTSES